MRASSELLRLLDHARRTTPYYATRIPPQDQWPDADPARLLSEIPLLSRRDIQRQGARLWSSEGHDVDWRLVRTTGTTDEPVEVVIDQHARRAEAHALAAHLDRCVGAVSWRECDVIHVTLHAGASSVTVGSPWHEGAQAVKWNLLQEWQRSDASFIDALQSIHGQVVTAMPSVIELVCSRFAAAGYEASVVPLIVVLSGQTVEARVREQVREALRCPVTSLYTLAEVGILAAECATTGWYHVEDDVAVIEVVDVSGRAVPAGVEGEIVVTPLRNRAMPLVRYRTGDRGVRPDHACGCGRRSELLCLTTARRPQRLITPGGATLNVVRFAKLFAGLSVNRVRVEQPSETSVRVTYDADRALDGGERALVLASLRGALGPEVSVTIRRGAKGTRTNAVLAEPSTFDVGHTEPEGPAPDEVARWLQRELQDRPALEAALITGSSLDVEAATKFSDIDLVLVVLGPILDADWGPLARRLRRKLPRLRVNVTRANGLAERNPLLAARLLREQHPVVGSLTEQLVPWPSAESLRRALALWSDDAGAALWTRLTDPDTADRDPLHEAWLASKYALDGLRYLCLIDGARETAARAVLELASCNPPGNWLGDVVEGFDVAREHRPPPAVGVGSCERYLTASLACVRHAAARSRLGA